MALGFAAVGDPGRSEAATSASVTATANVVTQISITSTSSIAFGDFTSGTAACTVTLNPGTGAVTATSPCQALAGSTTSSGTFDVSGAGNHTFTVAPAIGGTVTLTGQINSANTLTLTTAQTGLSSNSTGTLSSGSLVFHVGGSLAVGANQPADTYAGTLTLTVAYQ